MNLCLWRWRCLPGGPCLSEPSNWLMLANPSISGGIVSVHTRHILSRQEVTSIFETDPLWIFLHQTKNVFMKCFEKVCLLKYLLWHIFTSFPPWYMSYSSRMRYIYKSITVDWYWLTKMRMINILVGWKYCKQNKKIYLKRDLLF